MCSLHIAYQAFFIPNITLQISGAFTKLRKVTTGVATSAYPSVRPSVRMEQLGPHWTDFHEILYLRIFRNSAKKIKVCLNLIRITVTLHEDQYSFLIISLRILLEIRNISDKISTENQNTQFMLKNFFNFFFSKILSFFT